MSHVYIVFTKGEPPILDDAPQFGDDVRCVPVQLDPRAAKCLRALLDLGPNFEVASMLGALWQHGFNAGQRAGRSGPAPVTAPPTA